MIAKHERPIPRIKVCGLTRQVDTDLALSSGADALGFVHFETSPRHVPLEQIAKLISQLRHATAQVAFVGVLVEPTPRASLEFARATGVTWIQLAGPAEAALWVDFPLPILRSLPVSAAGAEEANRWSGIASALVLDHPSGPGGTGLQVAPQLARRMAREFPCLLAGGLHGGNLSELVQAIRPHGVDASSRLESRPGHKDPTRLNHYLREAKLALASTASKSR
ncbi:MAG: phosphoribosylanthranilate isomerase [Planctomycetota bacterium]